MKTIYGVGNPRIVYKANPTPVYFGSVDRIDNSIGLKSLNKTVFNDSLVNTCVYSVNQQGEETWARIISVDEKSESITCSVFSNLLPDYNAALYSKYICYDLPFSQSSMIESYAPQIVAYDMYDGGTYAEIIGWRYSVILDYSRKLKAEIAYYFEPLFDSARNYDVVFYPHSDNYLIYNTVYPDPETSIQIANKPFGIGHRYFKIKLNGKFRLSKINLTPTTFGIVTESGAYITANGSIVEPSL